MVKYIKGIEKKKEETSSLLEVSLHFWDCFAEKLLYM